MEQINKNIIRKSIKKYNQNLRWLKNAELDYSDLQKITCHGTFNIPPNVFSNSMYLGCPQAVICVGQMGYVAWAEILKQGLVKSEMNIDEFLKLPNDAMYMIEAKKIRFKRKIPLHKDIHGKIILKDFREADITLIFADFDLENRGCFGSVEFAVQKELNKQYK